VATNTVLDSENAQAASGAGSDEVENIIIDTDDADQAASGAGSDEPNRDPLLLLSGACSHTLVLFHAWRQDTSMSS
jgi:hypothetical protein